MTGALIGVGGVLAGSALTIVANLLVQRSANKSAELEARQRHVAETAAPLLTAAAEASMFINHLGVIVDFGRPAVLTQLRRYQRVGARFEAASFSFRLVAPLELVDANDAMLRASKDLLALLDRVMERKDQRPTRDEWNTATEIWAAARRDFADACNAWIHGRPQSPASPALPADGMPQIPPAGPPSP